MTQSDSRLSCSEVEELLPLVVDGVITEDDEPELFRHLGECAHCQASLAAHDLISFALAPQHLPLKPTPSQGTIPFPWTWLASAAGIVALGSAGLLWLSNPASPHPGAQAGQPTSAILELEQDGHGLTSSSDVEVLQILRPGPGREQPLFVIRENGRIVVLPSEDLDGGHYRAGHDHPAQLPDQPRHIRASDVRHIGHFD